MNVLRMIKLFGWERKINGRIRGQRVEELSLTRKRSFLQLSSDMIKYVYPFFVRWWINDDLLIALSYLMLSCLSPTRSM